RAVRQRRGRGPLPGARAPVPLTAEDLLFFGVEDHPTTSFRSTGVRPDDGENHWKVDGELTIKGTTRPVTVDVEFLGGAIDPWGNQKIGFSGLVPEVNREDWGLTWNAALETGGFLLARNVRLEIEAELVKK
ncbi:MAG: YceI family protein, partial [Actinomycetota bacterium]